MFWWTNFSLLLYKNVRIVSVARCKYYDSISYLILHDFYLASFHSLQIFDAALHSSLVLSHCFVISSEAAAVSLLLSTQVNFSWLFICQFLYLSPHIMQCFILFYITPKSFKKYPPTITLLLEYKSE